MDHCFIDPHIRSDEMTVRVFAALAFATLLFQGAQAAERGASVASAPYRQTANGNLDLSAVEGKTERRDVSAPKAAPPQPELCCNIPNDPVAY